MSYIYISTIINVPTYANNIFEVNLIKGYWLGIGADAGLFCYSVEGLHGYIISNSLYNLNIKCNNQSFAPLYEEINGQIAFSSGSNFIYYDNIHRWVYNNFYAGYSPNEYKDDNDNYYGDSFYVCGNINNLLGNNPVTEITFEGRGSKRGQSITVSNKVNSWKTNQNSVAGTYSPIGDAEGTKTIGYPYWDATPSNYGYHFILRSVNNVNFYEPYYKAYKSSQIKYSRNHSFYYQGKNGHDCYKYRSFWILGNITTEYRDNKTYLVWYEGEEPQKDREVEFKKMQYFNEEFSEVPDAEVITLTFKGYHIGNKLSHIYMGEIATWK